MLLACRNVCVLGCAALLSAVLSNAQSVASQSSNPHCRLVVEPDRAGAARRRRCAGKSGGFAASPAPAAQDNNDTYSGWHGSDLKNRLTLEAGGGFNAPIGNDTVRYITWGGNFTLGAGVRFSKRISALLEYQFMDNKLPGAFIASVNSGNTSGTPITGGDAHINSITGSPVIDLTPNRSNGAYVVGGWGYYHKSTNFNGYECCEISYYGEYPVSVTLASITSNQWGGNAGAGIYHRFGGMYGGQQNAGFCRGALHIYSYASPWRLQFIGRISFRAGQRPGNYGVDSCHPGRALLRAA